MMSSEHEKRIAEIRSMMESTELDIWSVIKRAHTTDPYIIMAKYRMNRNSIKRARTAGKVIERGRRKASNTESVGGCSNESRASIVYCDGVGVYEEDTLDAEEEAPALFTPVEHCQDMYVRACKEYGVHPMTYVQTALRTSKCILRHRQITPYDTKPIAVALVGNSSIETLDLSDNDVGPCGAQYIADTLKENSFIKTLILADNNLGIVGVKYIVDVIETSDNVNYLSFAGNGLRECDAEVIRPLFENTYHLKHLDLSRNQLRESGGAVIGEALLDNDSLESLDLSWNHLRRDGACFIADGLKENICLKKLNIAWNGFYLDGCRALAKALKINKTLIELDLTCNRISKECLAKLIGGLKRNTTLEILRLGLNPITPVGAMALLEFIEENKSSGIKELDLRDQLVEPSFVALLAEIQVHREIKVIYGLVRGEDKHSEEDERHLMDENPVIVLMEFGKLMGFRLMDLFAALDKDGSKSLDHAEIRTGLRMVNIPLSDKCIEILIKKLDVDGDGEIDFGELLAAQIEHRKQLSIFLSTSDDFDIGDTEIGRVRTKLSRLMSKKMSGNPAFKTAVDHMKEVLTEHAGNAKLAGNMNDSIAKKLSESLAHHRDKMQSDSIATPNVKVADKMKKWKSMSS